MSRVVMAVFDRIDAIWVATFMHVLAHES